MSRSLFNRSAVKIGRAVIHSCLVRRFYSTLRSMYNVVFVLGGPGAGKGTQCANIVENFGYVHLSAGELLRQERNRGEGELSEMIQGHMKAGTIVPVAVTCRLLEQAMDQSGKCKFLIDGFPRNEDNLSGWKEAMSSKTNLQAVLFLDCSEEVCVNRCLSRGKDSGRADDNADTLRKRIETYNGQTKPIIDLYDKTGLVRRINADQNPEQVFKDIKKVFEAL